MKAIQYILSHPNGRIITVEFHADQNGTDETNLESWAPMNLRGYPHTHVHELLDAGWRLANWMVVHVDTVTEPGGGKNSTCSTVWKRTEQRITKDVLMGALDL